MLEMPKKTLKNFSSFGANFRRFELAINADLELTSNKRAGSNDVVFVALRAYPVR